MNNIALVYVGCVGDKLSFQLVIAWNILDRFREIHKAVFDRIYCDINHGQDEPLIDFSDRTTLIVKEDKLVLLKDVIFFVNESFKNTDKQKQIAKNSKGKGNLVQPKLGPNVLKRPR